VSHEIAERLAFIAGSEVLVDGSVLTGALWALQVGDEFESVVVDKIAGTPAVLVSPTTLHSVLVGQLAPDNGPTEPGRASVFHEPKPEVVFESIAPVELVVPPVATQFEPEHDTEVNGSRVPRFGTPPIWLVQFQVLLDVDQVAVTMSALPDVSPPTATHELVVTQVTESSSSS
jgi:hypothetical protein